jgi:hypothetical protein
MSGTTCFGNIIIFVVAKSWIPASLKSSNISRSWFFAKHLAFSHSESRFR